MGHGTLAELVEVVEPSPFRVVPRCRHAAVCGGCTWQHVAYAEQLRMKTRIVQAVLRHALHPEEPPVRQTIGTPAGEDGMPWGFRQKSAFVFAPAKDGGLAMGHFARGTHEVVPVVECPVHPERANRIAFALRDALRAAGVTAAGREPRGPGATRARAHHARRQRGRGAAGGLAPRRRRSTARCRPWPPRPSGPTASR